MVEEVFDYPITSGLELLRQPVSECRLGGLTESQRRDQSMNARFGEESNRKIAGAEGEVRRGGDSGITTGSDSCGRNFGADSTTRRSDDEGHTGGDTTPRCGDSSDGRRPSSGVDTEA